MLSSLEASALKRRTLVAQNACVNAGEDIEYDTLTTQILEVDLTEVRLRSPEVRSGSAYGRHFTREVYGEVFLK